MSKRYKLAEETINQADLDQLAAWLRTGPWLTQGPLVREFEAAWGQWLGTEHSVFCNSGSSANLLMYAALAESGNLRNNKVIVPAVSWATTVAPAMQLGFEPIICEADSETFGVDLNHFEALLKEHDPAAAIIVHVLGCPNDMDAIMALREEYGFKLMEDCCAAHGSTFNGQRVGSFGDVSSFSFFFGHHISTIEGGMVSTHDAKLAHLLLQLRSHGWAKDLPADVESQLAEEASPIPFNRIFTFYLAGYNLRASDLQARIGLMQMERLEEVVSRRMANHRVYQMQLADVEEVSFQQTEAGEISSISFAILASNPEHRERIASRLIANQVETRPIGGGNMSRQPFWRKRYGIIDLPMADRIHQAGMQLPNHHLLTEQDIAFICETVRAATSSKSLT